MLFFLFRAPVTISCVCPLIQWCLEVEMRFAARIDFAQYSAHLMLLG